MSSLISAAEKAAYASVIDDLHDTFKREITVINEVANAVVTDDENYNSMSDRRDQSVTYTANSETIYARVKYLDKAESEELLIFAGGQGDGSGGTSVPLPQKYGVIRIKVEKQYNDLVNESTKIIVDGIDCQLCNTSTPQSLFDLNYTTFYLVRQK